MLGQYQMFDRIITDGGQTQRFLNRNGDFFLTKVFKQSQYLNVLTPSPIAQTSFHQPAQSLEVLWQSPTV